MKKIFCKLAFKTFNQHQKHFKKMFKYSKLKYKRHRYRIYFCLTNLPKLKYLYQINFASWRVKACEGVETFEKQDTNVKNLKHLNALNRLMCE